MKPTRLKNAEIVQALSPVRLSSYRKTSQTDVETLATYKKNVQLSMALYPVVQQFEVVLRNQLERVLVRTYGSQWYISTSFIQTLDPWARNELQKTVAKLTRNNPSTHSGAIVSESIFGFWTALFGVHYNQTIWFNHDRDLFPFATTQQRHIQQIRTDLKVIRELRNRIAHHEPIWQDKDLLVKYQSMVRLLEWMNPQVALWLRRTKLDNFVKVFGVVYHLKVTKPRK